MPARKGVDARVAFQSSFTQCVVALRRALATTPLGILLAIWFCWGRVPPDHISLWAGGFAVIWLICLWLLMRIAREGSDASRHVAHLYWVAGLDGLAWGSISWFLMGESPVLDALLTALLCGVGAVNAPVYITFIRAYYVQAGSMWIVAMSGLLLIVNHPSIVNYGVGFTLFLVLMTYYMTGVAKRVFEGIQLQLANATLAAQLSVALQAVQLDAATDTLTGQGNRRALDELLSRQLRMSEKSGRPFSVLMLDIDFFKKINDTHGHMIGDDTLRAFAVRVREHLRQGDVCARFGGEEFVAVLPGARLEVALEVAERLRAGVADTPLLTSPLISVTVSIGAATLAPGQTLDELLGSADRAVYAAKSGGRNQVQAGT